jgi:hypothetical protein
MAMAMCFPLAAFGVTLGAHVLPSWRDIHLLMGALFLSTLLQVYFMPESLRWLSAQNNALCKLKLEHICKSVLKTSLEDYKNENPVPPKSVTAASAIDCGMRFVHMRTVLG